MFFSPRLRPLALLFSIACLAPLALAESPATADKGDEERVEDLRLPLDDLRTFTKVYEHIRKAYVEDIDDRTLLEYAIKGMLSELDPHSAYLNADSFDDLQVNTTGEFGGLGIEVGMENGFVKVISPIDNTPAAKAGVQAGDLIIKLDEHPVKGMDIGDAVEKMRGPKGSDITLTIVREGVDQPFELVITRDTIKVESVRSKVLEPGYGYIRIAQFQLGTGPDTRKAITELMTGDTPLKGLILDLRNNPGGVLQASVEVADNFLDEGLIVYTEGRLQNAELKYEAEPGDLTNDLPMVVLINEGSASASEIVAGALQDHRRAIILGTQSFGKGSVQTVIPLSEENAIKLTTALYYTPGGRSIQAQGISPDIEVERAQVTELRPRLNTKEANLQGHLLNGTEESAADSKNREDTQRKRTALFEQDNQMFEALNLLKGIHLFSNSQAGKPVATLQEQD